LVEKGDVRRCTSEIGIKARKIMESGEIVGQLSYGGAILFRDSQYGGMLAEEDKAGVDRAAWTAARASCAGRSM